MATHCIFLKQMSMFELQKFFNICQCVKIGCLFRLFQKKDRRENMGMLLQNNCTNNGVTTGLK